MGKSLYIFSIMLFFGVNFVCGNADDLQKYEALVKQGEISSLRKEVVTDHAQFSAQDFPENRMLCGKSGSYGWIIQNSQNGKYFELYYDAEKSLHCSLHATKVQAVDSLLHKLKLDPVQNSKQWNAKLLAQQTLIATVMFAMIYYGVKYYQAYKVEYVKSKKDKSEILTDVTWMPEFFKKIIRSYAHLESNMIAWADNKGFIDKNHWIVIKDIL